MEKAGIDKDDKQKRSRCRVNSPRPVVHGSDRDAVQAVQQTEHAERSGVRTTQVYLVAMSRMMCYLARAQLGVLLPFLTSELSLSSSDRGFLMSLYASGYLLTQIPGGILADKLGAYAVMAFAISATACCCMAAPLLAVAGISCFGIPFFLMGLCQGAVLPAGNVLMAQWILPSERSWASAINGIGACVGTLVISSLGAPIATRFGWRAVFYSTAASCMAFLGLWLVRAASSPDKCENVSEVEMTLLQIAGLATARAHTDPKVEEAAKIETEKGSPKKTGPVAFNPRLFLHPEVWAVILCHFVQNCQQYFAEWIPFFYSSQLAMSPELVSSQLTIIALVDVPARVLTKDLPGKVLNRGFSLLQCRQLMSVQGFAYHLILCTVFACFLRIDLKVPVLYTILFALSKASQAFHSGGYFANYLDLTRDYAGILTGVGNTMASCAGVVMPMFISSSLEHDDKNWSPVVFGLVFIDLVAIVLVTKSMSAESLDDRLQSAVVKPRQA